MNVDNNKQKVTIRLNIFTNINRKMYWCSKILCGLLMVALFKLTDSQTLHVCTNTTGSLCDLLCETTDQSVTISFTDPSTSSAGACLSNGACNSGITGYTASRVNSTFTRLRIDVLTFSRDYGNWSCSYGSSVSTLILLPCPSASDNVTINGENNDKGVNITCESKCQFPVSAYTSLKLHSKDGTLVTTEGSVSGSTPSASDGCENHEQNVILTYMVSSSRFCGNVEFSCSFDSTYLEQQTSDLSRPFKFEGSSDCVLTNSTIPTTVDVVSTTDKSTTSTTLSSAPKRLLSDEEVIIMAVSLTIGLFIIIIIVIVVVCLVRNNTKEKVNQKEHNNNDGSRRAKQKPRNESRQKHTAYSDIEGTRQKQHEVVSHSPGRDLHRQSQQNTRYNYNNYQPQILQGQHNYGFQDGQSPYNTDGAFYRRQEDRTNPRNPYYNDRVHRGYYSDTRNQNYETRSRKLYPSLPQQNYYYTHYPSSSRIRY